MQISIVKSAICLLTTCLLWSGLLQGCNTNGKAPKAKPMPESFTFLKIGVNTRIDSDVIDRLTKKLGPYAVDHHATIHLGLKYEGFLEKYYPSVYKLDRRLNLNSVVRKAHNATDLIFRNTERGDSLFDYAELAFDNRSGMPLMIKIISKKQISDLIESIKKKYGTPATKTLDGGQGTSYLFTIGNDVFIIAKFIGIYNNPQYYMLIVYGSRINQMLEYEQKTKPSNNGDSSNLF